MAGRVIKAASNTNGSLISVSANSHSLKRVLSNPLCLPEILISKHAIHPL